MKKLISILLIFTGLSFYSCEETFLGEDEANTSENNFELLWNDFNEHYALFGVKEIDWIDLYSEYRPQVTNQTSQDELWQIFSNLLEELNDGHVIINDRENNRFFESGSSHIDQTIAEFSLDLINTKYQDFYVNTNDLGLSYGKIKNKNIGYIHMYNVEGDNPEIIDDIILELKDYDAIIVDVRNNQGGDDDYAHRIAGAFADGEHFIYTVQTRNGLGYNDFDNPKKWHTKPVGSYQYLKPVILLTDSFTTSGAEILTLNMKAFQHVTHIGDTTSGDFSDQSPERFLPNGWSYKYSSQLYLLPSGESQEVIGIAPNVYSRNSEADIQAGNDLVLEESIQLLFDQYGID